MLIHELKISYLFMVGAALVLENEVIYGDLILIIINGLN